VSPILWKKKKKITSLWTNQWWTPQGGLYTFFRAAPWQVWKRGFDA